MKVLRLLVAAAALAALEATLAWRDHTRRAGASTAFVEGALLDPSHLSRAQRIVVREKPRTKVIHSEEGFEVKRVVDDDAPIRETVLVRRGDVWRVESQLDLEADPEWLGRTMSDLTQGRLTRFLTSDPDLMPDLGFDGTLIRLEGEGGRPIRQIELGRKDGGDAYQVVRIDERDAFVAKHEAEILGDPLAWIMTRVLRFTAADVRELDLPFLDSREPPLRLHRVAAGAPLEPARERAPRPGLVSQRAEELLSRLVSEPVLLVVPRDDPAARAAAGHVAARLRVTLFDGRRYEVGYGIVPTGEAALGPDVRNEDIVIMFVTSSDPQDVTQRYAEKAALVYTRASTLGRLPARRAALAAPPAAAEER